MDVTGFNAIELGGTVQERVAKVEITAAELLALNATPQTLVQAPGAGKYIEFVSATVYKQAGTAYTAGAGEDIAFKYTDGSGTQVSVSLETTGFLDQTTAQNRHVTKSTSNVTPVENAALVAHMLSGEVTGGTGSLYVTVLYRVHKNTTEAPK